MTTSADAPSFTPGALPAVTVPSFLNAGFEPAKRLGRRVGADRPRRDRRDRRALPLRNRDGQDLVREPAGLGRPRRAFCVAARRVLVLRRAADA